MRLAAVQADALLRRRHPHMTLEPLRSAEPEPPPDQLPALTPDANANHAALVRDRLAILHAEIESRAGVLLPSEDPDLEPDGEAWPDLARPRRDALFQPPRPVMPARQPQRQAARARTASVTISVTTRRILTSAAHPRRAGDHMASDVPKTGFRIVLISLSDGRTDGIPVCSYLASYNPEGADGNGVATWTRDPAQAMTFATGEAATACYRAVALNRPLRSVVIPRSCCIGWYGFGVSSTLDAQAGFQFMMREQVAPALREMGFRGTLRVFTYAAGRHAGSVRLQKSRHSSRRSVDFTFHVGAPCMGSEELVNLMTEQDRPARWWWTVVAGEPTAEVAESVAAAFRWYALPTILAALEDTDHDHRPEDDQDPAAPPIAPLRNPAYDAAGANPSSWFVQPAGHEVDWAFAELASPLSSDRYGAADTIARLALEDPRAVPALVDRLENDLSPHVRRAVASRFLAPLAGHEPVRLALHRAAINDPDCQVRWAARYALRLDNQHH